jgi:plasmid stability protein
MSTITVRGLDDEVIRALKVRAAREGRSMEAEVRGILTAATRSTGDERGFGTFLAGAFAGIEAPDMPARTDYPDPVDLP